MSILDGKKLVTHSSPKTYGDQLPGRYPKYKDGVEDTWTRTEAKAIRGLAAGYRPDTVAKKCGLKLRTINGWMGNPYFMAEVQRLADHYVFRYRPKVLEAVAKRAIDGSPQHARLFLLVTRDLKDEQIVKGAHIHATRDEFEDLSPEQLNDALNEEIRRFLGDEPPGDDAERSSRG